MELSDSDTRFKTLWRYFSGAAIFITLFISLMVIDHFNRKAWVESREAFLLKPRPGVCFVFMFKEDGMSPNPLSIGKVEGVEDDKILLRYSRQSHWEQGMAMGAAETCLKKNIKLPNMLKVTLEEFKHMDIWNIYFPEK